MTEAGRIANLKVEIEGQVRSAEALMRGGHGSMAALTRLAASERALEANLPKYSKFLRRLAEEDYRVTMLKEKLQVALVIRDMAHLAEQFGKARVAMHYYELAIVLDRMEGQYIESVTDSISGFKIAKRANDTTLQKFFASVAVRDGKRLDREIRNLKAGEKNYLPGGYADYLESRKQKLDKQGLPELLAYRSK